MNKVTINVYIQVLYELSVHLSTYLEVSGLAEWNNKYIFNFIRKQPNCFPEWVYHFALPPTLYEIQLLYIKCEIVLHLGLWSLLNWHTSHLIQGVRCVKFHFLYMDPHLSSTICYKDCPFSIAIALLPKVDYLCGSVSGLSSFFHWSVSPLSSISCCLDYY